MPVREVTIEHLPTGERLVVAEGAVGLYTGSGAWRVISGVTERPTPAELQGSVPGLGPNQIRAPGGELFDPARQRYAPGVAFGAPVTGTQPSGLVAAADTRIQTFPSNLQDSARMQAPIVASMNLPSVVPEGGTRVNQQLVGPEFRIGANDEVFVKVNGQWIKPPSGAIPFTWNQAANQWEVIVDGKTYPATRGSDPEEAIGGDQQGALSYTFPGKRRGPGAGSSTFGMRLDNMGRVVDGASGGERPAWWPANIPYKTKRVRVGTKDLVDEQGGKRGEEFVFEDQPDVDFFETARREARLGEPKKQKSLDDLIADALASGGSSGLARAQGLWAFKKQLTESEQAIAAENLKQEQLQTELDSLKLAWERSVQDTEKRKIEQEYLRTQQQIRDGALRLQAGELSLTQLRQRIAQEGNEEIRAAAEFTLNQQIKESAERRAVGGFQTQEQRFAAEERRRQEAFGPEQARLAAGERRAQGRFGLQEEAQRFGQGLQERQFGLQEQAQRFGQGLSTLGAGLNILRSPGDYYLYQTRLRDQQASSTPYTGQEIAPRGAFLQPFAQQLAGGLSGLGGQQELATQAGSPGLAQALAGQTVSRPRQLPNVGAPAFLSLQDQARLLPSEREMRSAEVGALGIPQEDYEEQERRTYPRAFGPLSLQAAARRRVAA